MSDGVTKLNLGAGSTHIEGFTPVDRKHGQEVYPLDYPDDSVDEIRASHILEHFSHDEILDVLKDWVRALKPGGLMRVAVPDFAFIADSYHRGTESPDLLFAYAMGGQVDADDFHKSLFDEPHLRMALRTAGLQNIRHWRDTVPDCSGLPVSLNLEGVKRQPREQVQLPKVIAIMSTAKLGFTENLFCAQSNFYRLKIDLIKHTGAYWGQCLERVMEEAIKQGAEWVITLDYDTVFGPAQLDELLYLMATHPEADAIAPWQIKREGQDALVLFMDEQGQRRSVLPMSELDQDLVRADDAHFGLTVLRCGALARMEHPWFHAVPDPEGKWGTHRLDDDIAFWRKWKAAGNTLYIAGRVSIGHLQQVVTWPSESLQLMHQYITDFQQHGPPLGVRQ